MDFLSKADLMSMYGCIHPDQFGRLLGEKGREVLGWQKGKQRFSPKQVRDLQGLIGLPLTKKEKYGE